MVKRYQCGSTGSSASILKIPDNIAVKCQARSWIISPGTKCEVQCSSGTPKYDVIHCKTAGWRPSNKLTCEGTSAGVIVAIIIAVIAGVVLIAFGFAKYLQIKKRKEGKTMTVQSGKKTSSVSSFRHAPMRNSALVDRTHSVSSGYVGSEPSSLIGPKSGLWKSGSRSHLPSYTSDAVPQKSAMHLPPFDSPYEFEASGPYSRGMDPGFHSYQLGERQLPPYAEGSRDPYFQEQFSQGYPSAPPMMEYNSQPHMYPAGTNKSYNTPYHVSQ